MILAGDSIALRATWLCPCRNTVALSRESRTPVVRLPEVYRKAVGKAMFLIRRRKRIMSFRDAVKTGKVVD